ncbi:GH92 family glycosyl hydrolase [Luteimonas abyssi]|uniref:GH92 family glycosyl hydrolase n=1 Tax=Luteimonas abyssi TaxID=1247514 RepID=UPI000737AEC2|nr:GH92 family glycosyl hydrolase [Luteimonas abyssi]
MIKRGVAVATLVGALLGAGVVLAGPSAVGERAFDAVDPFIGTGGEGHTYPGATVPFGMVQLSPDTRIQPRENGYDWAAGYRYEDETIVGFSHTHFSGTGHSDLGDFLVMPFTGDPGIERGDPDVPRSGYTSRYDHDTEHAEPGYYAVTLDDYRVRAELTTSARTGVHRYAFPAGEEARVLLDLRTSMYDYPGKILWSRLRQRADGTVTGFRETRGWAPGRQLYFAMRFSRPIQGHAFHNTETDILYRGFTTPAHDTPTRRAQIEGRQLVGTFDFGVLDAPLIVTVAISPVSEAGAIANLDAEVADFDFDRVRTAAKQEWIEALSVLDIDAPESDRRSAYTALYHTLLGPTLFMDADGRYRGPDNAVHQAEGFNHYSTFSLWDTYRALHPLLTLVQPEARNADFINSLVAHQRHSPYGILPVWSFHGLETWTMIGYHAVPVIADAWLKGLRGFDADAALDAMIASATYPEYDGLEQYMELGWVPIDEEVEAASKTLEYAYGDWTLARMAEGMGRTEVARDFDRRAAFWRNAFDPRTGFMRAKNRDGSFREPFDPTASGYGTDYTEGNAWQYSWYVPHDIAGLVDAHGGADALLAKLDEVFEADVDESIFDHMEDIVGLIGWYAHGNEPSHHVAYLYAHAGQPWRTQSRLKTIMDTQYADRPDGLAGNDDLGQMSAWYLFTALGFYPVAPGSGEYVIGRPFLPRASLHLPNGETFTIVAEGLDQGHGYIASATLNGQPLNRTFLRHDEIVAGGELRFVMQAEPNRAWPGEGAEAPYSLSTQ